MGLGWLRLGTVTWLVGLCWLHSATIGEETAARWVSLATLGLLLGALTVVSMAAAAAIRLWLEVSSLIIQVAFDYAVLQLTGGLGSPFLFVLLVSPLTYGLRAGIYTAFGSAAANTAMVALLVFTSSSSVSSALTRRSICGAIALLGVMWGETAAITYLVRLYSAQQRELVYLAERDPLTGLFNRRVLVQKMHSFILGGNPFCLILVDLDRFKDVNDSLGHLVGDEILQHLGSLMLRTVRSTDVLARYGGDEFAILLEGQYQDAATVLFRIKEAVRGLGASRGLRLDLSGGIAAWPDDARAPLELLQIADARLYAAKQAQCARA